MAVVGPVGVPVPDVNTLYEHVAGLVQVSVMTTFVLGASEAVSNPPTRSPPVAFTIVIPPQVAEVDVPAKAAHPPKLIV